MSLSNAFVSIGLVILENFKTISESTFVSISLGIFYEFSIKLVLISYSIYHYFFLLCIIQYFKPILVNIKPQSDSDNRDCHDLFTIF